MAAGVGLNVTHANHVIHYTRHWNPAKEEQATDRAYRIGQEKDVHVYYPMAVFPDKMKNEDGSKQKIF
ncbi:MAG: SWF/SNF helicase family protein [Bacteroidetes bacterium]|nr:SWF/SNF helicase family protein [Bacteroidota bacterium]